MVGQGELESNIRLPEQVERVLRQIELPIRIEDIPDGKEWLFLSGFKDPDPHHKAFDFSAYETMDSKIKLGIPSTIVRAPFSGTILRADDDRKKTWDVHGEPGYGGEIEIIGRINDCIATAVLAHIVPSVGLGRVEKGTIIGSTFESPNNDKGTLGHLHFQLDIAYAGMRYPIDPIGSLFRGLPLKRIYLPHSGPFTKEELQKLGFDTRYTDTLNYQIATPSAKKPFSK